MAAMRLQFTVALDLTEDEYRLIRLALDRQLKGDDVGAARKLREKLDGERTRLSAELSAAGAVVAGMAAAQVGGTEPDEEEGEAGTGK